jgi:hypothetical protein
MVITRTEFDKAMKEINTFAEEVYKRLDALEAAAKEPEEKKVAAKAK